MRTSKLTVGILSAVACCLGGAAQAGRFEPMILAGNPEGEATVLTPGAAEAVRAEFQKPYAYGSVFMTTAGSTLPIVLSTGNEGILTGNSRLASSEDPADAKHKLLTLEYGRLDVTLQQDYQKDNTLDVGSACARASFGTGGKATFESVTEDELNVFVVSCGDTTLSVWGPQFAIERMDREDVVSVACAPDLSFIRVKNVRGDVEVKIRDADGKPLAVAMESGAVLKILQKRSDVENAIVVTLLIVGPDEAVRQAIVYSVQVGSEGMAVTPPAPPAQPGAEKPKPPKEGAPGEWEPMYASVPSTTTTSTTAVPDIDIASAEAYRRSLIPLPPTTTTTTRPPVTPTGHL